MPESIIEETFTNKLFKNHHCSDGFYKFASKTIIKQNRMKKENLNINKQFMVGNGILAFGVFFIVCLFLYLGFRFQQKEDKPQVFEDFYTITLSNQFAGDSIAVYINDSLLFNRTVQEGGLKMQVNRFAEENVLMVVDSKTDALTPFNLSKEGSLVNIDKKNGKIWIEESH